MKGWARAARLTIYTMLPASVIHFFWKHALQRIMIGMSCPSWQWHRAGYSWSPVRTLPVALLWCNLGLRSLLLNSRGNKAVATPRLIMIGVEGLHLLCFETLSWWLESSSSVYTYPCTQIILGLQSRYNLYNPLVSLTMQVRQPMQVRQYRKRKPLTLVHFLGSEALALDPMPTNQGSWSH